jgi:hypothetical protein
MKYPILCVILIATLLFALPATASSLDDKVVALKLAVKKEIEDKQRTAPDPGSAPGYVSILASFDGLSDDLANRGTRLKAETELTGMLTMFTSEAVQQAAQAVEEQLHREDQQRIDDLTAQIQDVFKRATDEVPKAKKAEDLDSLVSDLQKVQNSASNDYTPISQTLYQEIGPALEFVKQWQNFLSDLSTGQKADAINALSAIGQNGFADGVMPRSKVLAILAQLNVPGSSPTRTPSLPKPSDAEAILAEITSLDEMEPALKKLALLRQNDSQAQMAYMNLAALVQNYNDVKAGLPANPNFNANYNNGMAVSSDLKAKLLLFDLQHYFDSYKGTSPSAEEKPEIYVGRVIDDAVNREDWALLKKALNVQSYWNRDSMFGLYGGNNNSSGVDDILAAVNQEDAHQYALEVVSLQNALKSPDTKVPAKWIGDRLAALERDHPKEYAVGMQMVIPNVPSAK